MENFLVKDGFFCGLFCKLVNPNHIGTKFTQKNKILRSSIWTDDGELLSAGFFKFVNFGENPENFPVPLSIDNCVFVEKIDGSLTCIDFVNDQISMRTRGTFSIETMENKSDFDYCLAKHPSIIEWLKINSNYTLLCEITTPNLKIVIDYGNEPAFRLVGAVNKHDYSLMTQIELDELGIKLGLTRPISFSFNSIDELLSDVATWTDKEGICLYSKNGQEIHKIKAEVYLKLHRFKSNATLENTLELFVEYNYPTYQEFETMLQTQFDYECWNMIRGFASSICDASKQVKQIIDGITNFVEPSKSVPRRIAAQSILSSYGTTGRSNMAFTLLDGKPLSTDQIKKLYWQVLKK